MASRERTTRKVGPETNLARNKGGTREERRSFLILCEGKTEKDYFVGMRSRRGPQLDVDIPKGDHLAKVREAVSRASDEYDGVWCVVDTELNESLTCDLVKEAKNGPIELGLSTPSFELWLILHHADCARPFQSADDAKRRLKEVLPTWSEGNTRFADFSGRVDAACRRARKLDPDGRDPLRNPSTGVWRLVESLRG
ncbi:RloB family protein [Sphaerisporangium corydalis]|uniref:RloB family protein n=1 Tax=Sphaerisporangium corydalis TaxID=1441875 RepID=A0ABV9ESA8_9ACTN|nr:RloB family protein [Sphaerisporangium corydalis]